MLTCRETGTFICQEINPAGKTENRIYYHDNGKIKQEYNEQEDRYLCHYCHKWIRRKDAFISHQKGCKVRIIMEQINQHIDFKEYTCTSFNHLQLCLPFKGIEQGHAPLGLRMYISGPARCGKSTLISKLMLQYYQENKNLDKHIYFFSQLDSDKVIDDMAEVINEGEEIFLRVNLNSLIEEPDDEEEALTIDDFRGSLCIFDDIDKITNKKILKAVDDLKDNILATGRDHNYQGEDIDLIVSNHRSLGYRRTMELLEQANYIVLFPNGVSVHNIQTVAQKYCGLSKAQVEKINQSNSRYIIIHKEVPLFVIEEKRVWLVK